MSASKPVIVTDAVGCSEEVVQDGGNGLIIKHGNSNELKRAIDKIISDDKLIKKMSEKSRKIWESINWDDFINGYKKAIEYSMS